MNQNIFKSIDDFRSSELWKRINSDTTPKVNIRVLHSTRLENMIYTDLRERVKTGLNKIEADGIAKLDTFPELMQDTFQSLYSLNPRRNNADTLTSNIRHFNAEIVDSIMSSNQYPALKSLCEGRELPAYEAVNEFSQCMLNKLDELLNTETLDELNALAQQQEQLKAKIMDIMEYGEPDDEESVLNMAENIAENDRQIEQLSRTVKRNIRKNNDIIQSCIASATEKAQEASDIIRSWGNGDSSPEAIRKNTELLRRVQSSQKLRDIVKYLGKYREILDNARKSSYTYGRGEKYDIVLGNDFTRAVSSEYVYLALTETVPLFIQKVQRKTLKQYRKRERTAKGYGDIVVCIDESSSMQGDSIAWAKALALTLLEYAAQNRRSCGMIRFASANNTVVNIYDKGKYTTDDVLDFAESFLNGGTDFEEPLTQAVTLIEHEGFENADVVFITDGECGICDEFASSFCEKSKQLKFNVTGIIIDADNPSMNCSIEPCCEKVYRLSELTGDSIAADIIGAKLNNR